MANEEIRSVGVGADSDSFAYLVPQPNDAQGRIPLAVRSVGHTPLVGLSVEIHDTSDLSSEPQTFEVGPIPSDQVRLLRGAFLQAPALGTQRVYVVLLHATTGTLQQTIGLRTSARPNGLFVASMLNVTRIPPIASIGASPPVILVNQGWSDDPPTTMPAAPLAGATETLTTSRIPIPSMSNAAPSPKAPSQQRYWWLPITVSLALGAVFAPFTVCGNLSQQKQGQLVEQQLATAPPCGLLDFRSPRVDWDTGRTTIRKCDNATFTVKGSYLNGRRTIEITFKSAGGLEATCAYQCEVDPDPIGHEEGNSSCSFLGPSRVICSDAHEIRVLSTKAPL